MNALDRASIEALIARGDIDTVVCATPDIWGRLMGKRVTGRTFLKTALGDEGLHGSLYVFVVDMDMDPRPGFALTSWDTGYHDCHYAPDLSTLHRVPWHDKTAMVLCDLRDEHSGAPVAVSPRAILKRQVEAAAALGFGVKCASELEFFLFKDSFEAAWHKEYQGLDPTSTYRGDYHILQSAKDEPFLQAVRRHLDDIGIEIEFSKTEWGLGQQEINLRYTDAIEMADRHALYKNAIKELAAQAGLSATFMAKPWAHEIGSSCHLHTSLWSADGATPLSWDGNAPGHMSAAFGAFVAGQLERTRELAFLVGHTVNAYKRFRPESFAPTAIALGDDNRTCGFRLCGHGPSFRVENRIPGADANPYLAIAASIAAGLDGIRRKLKAPEIYRANAYRDAALPRVPMALHEALPLFEQSAFAREALGAEVHAHLANFGRQELAAFDHECVTDWERKRYFERI
ncbi:MAG: glutamine synthetase [Alphaproteobacteria bacterium]|nr:glutamine synthetase [Alphaproteobacteria bacterium]